MPIDKSLIEEMTREFFNGQYPYVKVVPRLEATDQGWFAEEASSFAKVREKYTAYLTRGTKGETRKSLLSRWPKPRSFGDAVTHVNSFGRHSFLITKHRGGWVVERAADCFGHFDILPPPL